MQQKSQQQKPTDQAANPLDDPQALVQQLREAYLRDNEREVPAQSSKILYQCFHPLKDKLQAVYTKEKVQKGRGLNENGIIEQDPESAQHDVDDAERSLAYEYVVILEELAPAQTHKAKHAKDQDDNAGTLFMSNAQSLYMESLVGDAKKDDGAASSDDPHRKYPERYRLQSTQHAAQGPRKSIKKNTDQIPSLYTSTQKLLMDIGGGSGYLEAQPSKARIFDIQTNEDDDEDDDEYSRREIEEELKFDGQQRALLNLIDIEDQDDEDLDEKIKEMKKRKGPLANPVNLKGQPSIISYKPSVLPSTGLTGLPGYGDVHAHRRAWELFENSYDNDQPGATMPKFLKEINSKSVSLYDVKEPFVLPSYEGENDTVQFKEFKLTLWRINKFQQSRHVLAQQCLTIWGEPDLQVMFKRFSFTCDLKYIYMTFYTPHNDALFKTVVLESKTLEKVEGAEYWYYRNSNNGMDASTSLKVSDVTVEPVMFRLGPESSKTICEREGIKSSTFAAQYGMYFHTQQQGMFFLSLGRVALTYPFTRDYGGFQSQRSNTLDLANNLLSSGEVKNVFFNVEENEAVIEDRMLILLQCKQRSLTSGMDRGDDTSQKVSLSRQGEDDRREVVCPFKVIVVDIAKLLIKMFVGNFDYVDKEDSEFRQVVNIALPNTQFEDMILFKTFFTRKFGIIGQTILKNDVLTSPSATQLEDPQILLENIGQAIAAVDTQYLLQIPLTTMARDVSAEYRISAQIFPMKGGMRLPSNPQLQIRLSLKANSQNLDSRQRNASMQGSYAIYMDDLIFYKGVLGSMIANRRAVYVPKEIENACLFDPDFFLSQETDDQLNLMEINLEDNQTALPQAIANTSAKKGINSQEDDFENLPAQRSIRPRPTVHYLKPEYSRDPQTREFFIQDTFLADINIKTPDVHFLDPYIITVEDKTRVVVYSSVDPDRYFIYDLELHFELFVELGCPSIVIDDKTYYHHQVSLFLTYDLESNQHRLECLILPSYDQMSYNRQANMHQVFMHYRFPYMIDFEPEYPLDISTVGDLALTAQLLQIPEKAGYQADTQKKLYQDVLVLQTQESILIYDLIPLRPCSQRGKYPTYLSQVPIIRANEHVVKSIVCAVPNIQNVNDQDALRKIEKNGYPTIYFAYLNGTDTEPNRPGLYMLKIKSKTIGSPSVSGNASKEEGDDNTSQQRKSRPYLIYEFPPSSESTEDRILAMSISEEDTEGVSLVIMDSLFTIKVLKLELKNAQWRLRLNETSIQPLEQVEQIWNRLTSVSHGEGIRPRIILTDQGAYLESLFSAFIPSGSFRAQAQLDFEANRDTKLSQRLKARDGTQTRIWLNSDGVRSSQGQLLMQYRREHISHKGGQQTDGKKADMLKENLKMSDAMMSGRMSIRNQQNLKSRLSIRKMTVKNGGGGNLVQPATLIPQQPKVSEHHFFLVVSEMRSRIKRLMSDSNDAFVRDQVVFTSFIGNMEEDDILVVLKNGRYLIFDNSGRIVQLEAYFKFIDVTAKNKVQYRFFGEKELCKFTIVDTLNVMSSEKNCLKLLILNKETGEYFIAELQLSPRASNGIKSYTIKNTINLQQVSYRIKKNKSDTSGLLPRGYDQGPEENEGQDYIIKFDTEGNVGKFVYPEVVKLDSSKANGFELKQNDFTMTLNLNKDKKINEMIQGIVERNIKSQISEKGRRDEQKKREQMDLEEILLSEDDNEMEFVKFKRGDFDFFDLKAYMEMNGVRKQIRYFVFRYKNEVAYQRIISDVEKQKDSKGLTIDNTVSETFKLDLNLRKAGIITQFLPVDNQHHIQFMFYDPTCKRFFLFTWDLQANREVKMLKLEKTYENPYFQLTRGASLRQNYIVMHGLDEIYDLRLEFSQNFISGQRVWGSRRDFENDFTDYNEVGLSDEERFKALLFRQAQTQMHEIKANYDGSFFLGLRKTTQTQIHRGFSLFDLQYIDFILRLYGLESKTFKNQASMLAQPLILDYLNVLLPYNANILHLYHRSSYFLSIFLRELTDQMQYIQSDPKNPHAEEICPFLYYSLIPATLTEGVKGKRALSMALKSSYGECFELMVQMLMLDPCGINYMRHIKHYIIKLLSYDSDIIRNFLQKKCSSQLYSLMLTADEQERYFENYLGTNSEYINLVDNEEYEQSKEKARIATILRVAIAKRVAGDRVDQGESEDEHQEIERQKRINDELVQKNKAQKKQINLYSYDFDGYLVGERSKLFLSYIVQQDNNLKIFDLNYIKMYLDYQWRKLKNRYFQLLLAYIINNVLMVVYVAMQVIQLNCSQEDFNQNFCQYSLTRIYSELETQKGIDYVFFIFRIFLIAFSVILIYIEFIRQKNSKNFLTTFFLWINIAYVLKQCADIGMEIWFKKLMQGYKPYPLPEDFLRLGAYGQTNKDWEARIVRIPIFLIKATNSFFMLALPMQLLYKVRFLPGMSIYLPKFFSAIQQIRDLVVIFITFTFSFLFSYTILSVLDFRMGGLENINDLLDPKNDKIDPNYRLIMGIASPLFGVFSQVMIQLIFCFGIMMIMYMGAAMIKADQKATEEFEQLKLINLARLIVENELLINRKKLYENVHYVIHSDVKKEKIRSAFTIMNSKDQAKMEKKLAGGRRQKRQCCAAMMQGKPLELVYEVK